MGSNPIWDFSESTFLLIFNIVSGDKHCIPTHFDTELDVSYASRHTFSKVTVTNV